MDEQTSSINLLLFIIISKCLVVQKLNNLNQYNSIKNEEFLSAIKHPNHDQKSMIRS